MTWARPTPWWPMDELRRLLDAMPAPAATANVDQLEAELASTFGASHAVGSM